MYSAQYIQMEKVKLSPKKPSVRSILQHLFCSLILGTMSTAHLLPDVSSSSPGEQGGGRQLTYFKTAQLKELYNFFIVIIIINNITFIQTDTSTYCINRSSFFQWKHVNRKSIAGISEEKKPYCFSIFFTVKSRWCCHTI